MALVQFPSVSIVREHITQQELGIGFEFQRRADEYMEHLYGKYHRGAIVDPGPLLLAMRHRPPDAIRIRPDCEYCQLDRSACANCPVPGRHLVQTIS